MITKIEGKVAGGSYCVNVSKLTSDRYTLTSKVDNCELSINTDLVGMWEIKEAIAKILECYRVKYE